MKTHTTNTLTWWDRVMIAVTFAEADETKTAEEFIRDIPRAGKKTKTCAGINTQHGFAR